MNSDLTLDQVIESYEQTLALMPEDGPGTLMVESFLLLAKATKQEIQHAKQSMPYL